eukprot:jgi/Botrbrau1/20836/Bobra.0156s0061.1
MAPTRYTRSDQFALCMRDRLLTFTWMRKAIMKIFTSGLGPASMGNPPQPLKQGDQSPQPFATGGSTSTYKAIRSHASHKCSRSQCIVVVAIVKGF